MGHEMFDFDAELADKVFTYCRERLDDGSGPPRLRQPDGYS